MAQVNSTRGVKLVLKVLTVVSPPTYAALCTINAERGITFNAQTNDATIPDCADPDAIAWIVREKQSLSVDVTGGGMSDKSDVKRMWDFFEAETSTPCQIVLDDDTPANVITFEGNFHMTSFELTGNRGERVASSLSLSSDGEVTAEFGTNVGGS